MILKTFRNINAARLELKERGYIAISEKRELIPTADGNENAILRYEGDTATITRDLRVYNGWSRTREAYAKRSMI